MSEPNGRIHLLGDHRQPLPTKGDKLREQTIAIVEHYMVQLPAVLGNAINAALMAYDQGRREEFAAFVSALPEAERAGYETMLTIFGPRPVMPMGPDQPEQES